MQNGSALIESFQFNCGQQILSPLFSVLGSPGHETIDSSRQSTENTHVERCTTRLVRTTPHSAACRNSTSTKNRSRTLANQELIPTVSPAVTVPALRQGIKYTDVRTR